MSFQGDVAGLGLGELLQGLARGGREGVLTLRGGGIGARLGVQNGQLVLLPEADEDPEIWRKRSERAWAKDPDARVDALRMVEIAQAARIECMFQLLDGEGVHFRFEAGSVEELIHPRRPEPRPGEVALAPGESGAAIEFTQAVVGQPISVEYLLLEHARLSDELASHAGAVALSLHSVPVPLVREPPSQALERLWSHCDAASSLAEIADRLGWPIRQARANVMEQVEQGTLRIADAREMLDLACRELAENRFARAASRFSGWCMLATPGVPSKEDGDVLAFEWQRGKLPVVLASMDVRDARTLLRRLDRAAVDSEGATDVPAAIERWREVRKYHRADALCELKTLRWQLASDDDTLAPPLNELLRIARKFQEAGQPMRASALLRAVAARGPETTAMRLELGSRLIGVGLPAEGAPWIVGACRSLIEAGQAEKAVGPLRALVDAAPGNREARALLAFARNKTSSGRKSRRNTLIVLSSALAISFVAVIKIRSDRDFDERLANVEDQLGNPHIALSVLQEEFGDDDSSRVRSLRARIEARIAEDAEARRTQWLAQYGDAQLECSLGDPLLGLKRALDLPEVPAVAAPAGNWPNVALLFEGLAARLEEDFGEQASPVEATPEALHAEQRLERLTRDLLGLLPAPVEDPMLADFQARLGRIRDALRRRDEARAAEREKAMREATLAQQDMLLAAARAHTQAGDLERAVNTFHRLVEMPGSEQLAKILQKEIAEVEAHYGAVQEARALASSGKHADAIARLEAVCANPREHLLPCRVASEPTEARARFADGSVRVTPFTIEVAPGERIAFELEHAGCEPARVELDGPSDRHARLSRLPERWWRTRAPVEALPVSVADDHVVCDRAGSISRLSSASEPVWSQSLRSLGGIARTPVFLPKRPGSLLVLSEDGEAWIVDADQGRLEGPWSAGAPPVAGPEPQASTVRASFLGGTVATWKARLGPDVAVSSESPSASAGHDAGLAVLRRRGTLERALASPWTDLGVEVEERQFLVRRRATGEVLFAVRRDGDWSFVAWEAPRARLANGRLWISDGSGLRGFEP
jgi:tetratricopeptide (TPR) repeat protein